jgi:hypothetical protein
MKKKFLLMLVSIVVVLIVSSFALAKNSEYFGLGEIDFDEIPGDIVQVPVKNAEVITKFVPVFELGANNQLLPISAANMQIFASSSVSTYSASSTSFPTTTPTSPTASTTQFLDSVSTATNLYYSTSSNEYLVKITETGMSAYREFMMEKAYYKDGSMENPRDVYYSPWSVTIQGPQFQPTGRLYYWPTGYYKTNTNLDRLEYEYISWWTKLVTGNQTIYGYIWIGAQLDTY